MAFQLEREQRRLERKIEALRGREDLPEPVVDLVAALARLQLEAISTAEAEVPSKQDMASAEMVLQGAPLWPRESFAVDLKQSRELAGKVLDLLAETGERNADAAATLRRALESGELDWAEAVNKLIMADDSFFQTWAEQTPDAPDALRFVIQASITPSLQAVAMGVDEQREKGTWIHGHCPVCGSLPLIGHLEGKEGQQHFTCAFCRTAYRSKRLMCPFCGEQGHTKLSYFYADEEPGFQVHVCESCKMYFKDVDFRELDRTSVPVLDDLESLVMDMLAQEKGYVRPVPSAWGF